MTKTAERNVATAMECENTTHSISWVVQMAKALGWINKYSLYTINEINVITNGSGKRPLTKDASNK